jgi:hypothetical protein
VAALLARACAHPHFIFWELPVTPKSFKLLFIFIVVRHVVQKDS